MNHVWLVAGRDLREAFRSKAYWVTMALLLVGVGASIVLPRLLQSDPSYDLALTGEVPAALEDDLAAIADALDVELDVRTVDDVAAAERSVRDGEVDAALAFADDETTVIRRSQSSETLVGLAGQAAVSSSAGERLAEAGLTPAEAAEVLSIPPPTERTVDDEQPGRSGVAYATGLVLYLALFMGGMGVASGVAVEKSTRVAEVLVTTVRPAHLLAGKVLGVGASTLLLVLAGAVPFAIAIAQGAIDVPQAAALDVLGAVGWFILGYAIYAMGFAALGALVDRQEDLGGAIGPVTTALVLSYFATFQAQGDPDSTLAVVTSIFPLSSAMVMPVRIAEGAASLLEVALAIGVGLATFALLVRVGGTIYRRALLRGGRRLKVREVLRG
jgi:ABC-2 type transport system permease protein